MKKLISVILAALLALLTLTVSAEVVVRVNDGKSSNYRSAPNLDGEKLEALKSGETLPFAEETSTDDRGVVWYKVRVSDSETAWISSKYTTLTDGTTDGLTYDAETAGAEFVLTADDTLCVVPFKGVGETNLTEGTAVTATGYSVTADKVEFIYVTCDAGEGWLRLENLEPNEAAE